MFFLRKFLSSGVIITPIIEKSIAPPYKKKGSYPAPTSLGVLLTKAAGLEERLFVGYLQ